MFETYRMLGREREQELQREAERLHALPPSKVWARVRAAGSSARQLLCSGSRLAAKGPASSSNVDEVLSRPES
jgi:hypothetical protein